MAHRDIVFEVSGWLPVASTDGPTVTFLHDFFLSESNHRFDGEHHAFAQLDACATISLVRHLWVFVHFAPYSMSDELADDAVTELLDVTLHSVADVADTVACHRRLDAFVE